MPVTINSDDPPMFGTTLNAEYAIAADLLSLPADGVADLARAAGAGVVRPLSVTGLGVSETTRRTPRRTVEEVAPRVLRGRPRRA